MTTGNSIVLEIGGTKEGADFRVTADAEALRRLAHQILDCVENGKVGSWGNASNLVAIEEIQWEKKGVFRRSVETAFLSFERK
jgi:hypothetical protein